MMEIMNEKKTNYSRPAQVSREFGDGMKLCMTAIIKSCAVGRTRPSCMTQEGLR